MEQLGSDKLTFVREKIDDLVQKEVQLKLNNIAAATGGQIKNPHLVEREVQIKSKYSDGLTGVGDENRKLTAQIEHLNNEKQAFVMISNDI